MKSNTEPVFYTSDKVVASLGNIFSFDYQREVGCSYPAH
jgi:hypothetical protein